MEKSLDYRLFLVFEFTNLTLFIFSRRLTLQFELLIVGLVLSVILVISILNRIKNGWKLEFVDARQISKSIFFLLISLTFVIIASIIFNFTNPVLLPWIFFSLGIILFDVLKRLKIVDEYERYSGVTVVGNETNKLKVDQVVLILAFFIGVSFFAYFFMLVRTGSSVRVGTHVIPIINHAEIIYVTFQQRFTLYLLEAGMYVSIFLTLFLNLIKYFRHKKS